MVAHNRTHTHGRWLSVGLRQGRPWHAWVFIRSAGLVRFHDRQREMEVLISLALVFHYSAAYCRFRMYVSAVRFAPLCDHGLRPFFRLPSVSLCCVLCLCALPSTLCRARLSLSLSLSLSRSAAPLFSSGPANHGLCATVLQAFTPQSNLRELLRARVLPGGSSSRPRRTATVSSAGI